MRPLPPVRLGPPCRRPILNATTSSLYARRYTTLTFDALFFATRDVIVSGMKDIRWIPVALVVFLVSSGKALAWAQEGHAAIAALAEDLISPHTRAKVQEFLNQLVHNDLISIASLANLCLIPLS